MNILQKVLEQTIAEKRTSIREASRQSGLSHTTIARLLRGEPADISTLIKVSKWTGVSVSELLNSAASKDNLASNIAALVEMEPRLAEALDKALQRVLSGTMKPEVLQDLISYIIYRTGLGIDK